MSFWFINTLLVTLSIGIVAFVNKIFAQRKYDQKFSAMVLYGIMFLISLGYFLIYPSGHLTLSDIFLVSLFGISVYTYSLIMMTALRYLSTSTYFISVRLISSFTLLFIGIFFFGDHISLNSWLGFSLGVVAIALLFEREEKQKTSNYSKGLLLLLIGTISVIFGHTLYKNFSSRIDIAPIFLLISFLSAFITSLLFGVKTIKNNKLYFKEILKLNSAQAVLYFIYFVLLFKTYRLGALGISYKIQSYSPFIPIILSAIIYKEKISTKKKIALVLVAISLWFFK